MAQKPSPQVPPRHVGIIMDGNRRWAKSQGLSTFEGHFKGYHNMRDLALYAIKEKGVPYLSAYVFSTENWNRTKEEVGYLMNLVLKALEEYLEDFAKNNIRIVVLGSRDRLSRSVIKAIEKAEAATSQNSAGTVALCFNYGGQQEIIDAAKKLAEDKTKPADIDAKAFEQALYHPEVPPLDLIIRTSGEYRLSGFMLFRSAYAEFYFTDKHWPEFEKADIDEALAEFGRRQRRWGK